MTESEFSAKFMPALNREGHAVRIENVSESGTPDINYAIHGTQGWIETKVAKGPYLYFERFQIPWFRKRLRVTEGRHVWVLAKVGDHANLYPARVFIEAERSSYQKWTRVLTKDVTPQVVIDLNRPKWTAVIDALTEL